MRKLLILLLILAGFQASAQLPGATLINSRYEWLGGRFKQLKLPMYADTTQYPNWLPRLGGDIMLDTAGSDKGTVWLKYESYWHAFTGSGNTGGGGDTTFSVTLRTKYYADYSGSSSFTMPQVPIKIYGVEVWNIGGGINYPYANYNHVPGQATITLQDSLQEGDKLAFDYDYKNSIISMLDTAITYIQFVPPLYGEQDSLGTLVVIIDPDSIGGKPGGPEQAIQYKFNGDFAGSDTLKYNGAGLEIKHPTGFTSQMIDPIDGVFKFRAPMTAFYGLKIPNISTGSDGTVAIDADGDLYYKPIQWRDTIAGITYSGSAKVRDTLRARLGLFESNTGLTNYPLIVRNNFPGAYKTARFESEIVQVEYNTLAAPLSGNKFATTVFFDQGVLKGVIGYDGNVTPFGKIAMADVRNGADGTFEIEGATHGGFYNISGTSARFFFGAPPGYRFDYGQRVQVHGSLRVTDSIVLNKTTRITGGTGYDLLLRGADSVVTLLPYDSIAARIARSGGGGSYTPPTYTASRAMVTDGSGVPTVATTTATEIGYVNGVTSSIQTQINGKIGSANGIPYGITTGGTTAFSVTTSPNFGAPSQGQVIQIRPNTTNSGSSTLNVNGSGGVNLFKGTNQPLIAGDLVGARHYLVIFNGTTWQLVGEYNSIGTIGSGAANGLAISNGVITPHVATSTNPGMVSTADQEFAGRKGFGMAPTAKVTILNGDGSAGSAPLKLFHGSILNTPESGAVENDGTTLLYTNLSGVRMALMHSGETSSAATLTIANNNYLVRYFSFSGTTSTWTLPSTPLANQVIKIKNRGSGTITLNSGSSNIWNTSAVNTLAITAGSVYELWYDGTYWNVM